MSPRAKGFVYFSTTEKPAEETSGIASGAGGATSATDSEATRCASGEAQPSAAVERKTLEWLARARKTHSSNSLTPCKLIAVTSSKGKGLNFNKQNIMLANVWPADGAAVSAPPAHRACFEQLERENRLHDVTIKQLRDLGVKKFCWLFPGECIGHAVGQAAGSGIDGRKAQHWPHGAFAYFYDVDHCKYDCVAPLSRVETSNPSLPVEKAKK